MCDANMAPYGMYHVDVRECWNVWMFGDGCSCRMISENERLVADSFDESAEGLIGLIGEVEILDQFCKDCVLVLRQHTRDPLILEQCVMRKWHHMACSTWM